MDESWFRWALGLSEMITMRDIPKMYAHITDDMVCAEIMPALMDTMGWDVHHPSYLAGFFKACEFYKQLEKTQNNEV